MNENFQFDSCCCCCCERLQQQQRGLESIKFCKARGSRGNVMMLFLLLGILTMFDAGFCTVIDDGRGRNTSYRETVNMDLVAGERMQESAKDIEKWYKEYKGYGDIVHRLRELERHCHYSMKVEPIGTTVEEREIWAARVNVNASVGSNGGKAGGKGKRVLVTGVQHAREWVAGMTAMYVVDRLCAGVGVFDEEPIKIEGNDKRRRIGRVDLKDVEVVVVPVVNPDGFEYSRSHKTRRLWRKNRNKAVRDSSCIGVDLNRNWEYGFGEKGSDENPCHDRYRGKEPFSERETVALKNLIENERKYGGPVVAHVDLHSFGALLLRGLFWKKDDSSIKPQVRKSAIRVGRAMRVSMRHVDGMDYKYGRGIETLYQASGVMVDWMYQRNITSLTVELRPSSRNRKEDDSQFHLPEDQILVTSRESYEGLKVMLVHAQNPDNVPVYSDEEVNSLGRYGQRKLVNMIVAVAAGLICLLVFVGALYYLCIRRRGNQAKVKGGMGSSMPLSQTHSSSSFSL